MRLLVDNALSPVVAAKLRDAGHDAVHVRDWGLAGAPDDVIFDRAAADSRFVVSADADFGTLLAQRGSLRPSVVLLRRVAQRRPETLAALLVANLPTVEDALDAGAIVVIEEERIRVRALPLGGG